MSRGTRRSVRTIVVASASLVLLGCGAGEETRSCEQIEREWWAVMDRQRDAAVAGDGAGLSDARARTEELAFEWRANWCVPAGSPADE